MNRGLNSNLVRFFLTGVILTVSLAACAPSVKVRSDADPTVNFRQFQTYGFFTQMGIEGDNYSGLLGQHFRSAIATQMDSRGLPSLVRRSSRSMSPLELKIKCA